MVEIEAEVPDFSERVKELRKQKNMTQSELAEALQTTKGTVSVWERGVRKPDLATVGRIASLFEVTIDFLLGNSDFKTAEEEKQEGHDWAELDEYTDFVYMIELLAQVNPESLQAINKVISAFYRSDKARGNLRDMMSSKYFAGVKEKLL